MTEYKCIKIKFKEYNVFSKSDITFKCEQML